jgi:hypothetical protein
VVGAEDDRAERTLAEPVGREARVAEHRSWPVPRLSEVQLHADAKNAVQDIGEVRRDLRVGEVVAPSLDDVRGEKWWGRSRWTIRACAVTTEPMVRAVAIRGSCGYLRGYRPGRSLEPAGQVGGVRKGRLVLPQLARRRLIRHQGLIACRLECQAWRSS